jgi:hypothetical protein
MPEILLRDFADDSTASSKYPRHGWARNSQGFRLLWLPILWPIRFPENVRKKKGISQLPGFSIFRATGLYDVIRQLLVTLREIKSLERAIVSESLTDSEGMQRTFRERELLPIYVEAALSYLRRFADRFAIGAGPLLFGNYKSVSSKFRELRKDIRNPTKMAKAQPLCDLNLLRAAFDHHSGWFDILATERDSKVRREGGLRDALEHEGAFTYLGMQHLIDGRQRFLVSLAAYSIGRPTWREDLLSTLRHVVDEICSLCCDIHISVGIDGSYHGHDCMLVSGDDEDVTGFWPEI